MSFGVYKVKGTRAVFGGNISDLLSATVPNFNIVKGCTRSKSSYTSHHAPIEGLQICEFNILHNINEYFDAECVGTSSSFLGSLRRHEFLVNYANEQDIQSLVEKYIEDILIGLDWLDRTVQLVRQQAMANDTKADIWLVLKNGTPIGVVEVKTPGARKLDHPKVCGQIFDYMVQLRASYGRCEIFGIVTTLTEWRIFFFEDTKDHAKSNRCNNDIGAKMPPAQDLIRMFPIGGSFVTSRKICASPIVSIFDTNATLWIASALVKGFFAWHRPLPLLSKDRVYRTLSHDSFLWSSFPLTEEGNKVSLEMPPKSTKYFHVLRQFSPSADGNVFLCITDSLQICVLKAHFVVEDCRNEQSMLEILYGISSWIFKSGGVDYLVLPFVFHCIESILDDGHVSVTFDFDLSHWCKENQNIELLSDDEHLSVLRGRLIDAYISLGWNAVDVALMAIENVAARRCIHEDIDWRHVALLPNIQENGQIGLEPILIDLVRVETNIPHETALDVMTGRLREMIDDL